MKRTNCPALAQHAVASVHVVRAHLAGFVAGVVDLGVLEDVVVALHQDGLVRRVVDQAVRDAGAHAILDDAGLVSGPVPAVEVVQVAVLHQMARRQQRGRVAAAQGDAAVPEMFEIAADEDVVAAAVDEHAGNSHPAHDAAGQHDVLAARQRGPVQTPGLQGQVAERHMGDVLERQQRRLQQGHHRLAPPHRRRRPEEEHAALLVHVPLAWRVQFAEHVHGVVGAALDESAVRRQRLLDAQVALGRIDLLDLLVCSRVHARPVAVEPDFGLADPVRVAGVAVDEAVGAVDVLADEVAHVLADHVLDRDEALGEPGGGVRPARQRHRTVPEEQLEVGRHIRPPDAISPAPERTQILHPRRPEIRLQDMGLGGFGNPRPARGVGERPEVVDGHAAAQDRPLPRGRTVDDRGLRRAGIRLAEREAPGPGVDAAGQHDRDAALGQRGVRPGLAHRVAGPLQRSERSFPRAGIGVVAVRGEEEHGLRAGKPLDAAGTDTAERLALGQAADVGQAVQRRHPVVLVPADKGRADLLVLAPGLFVAPLVAPGIRVGEHGQPLEVGAARPGSPRRASHSRRASSKRPSRRKLSARASRASARVLRTGVAPSSSAGSSAKGRNAARTSSSGAGAAAGLLGQRMRPGKTFRQPPFEHAQRVPEPLDRLGRKRLVEERHLGNLEVQHAQAIAALPDAQLGEPVGRRVGTVHQRLGLGRPVEVDQEPPPVPCAGDMVPASPAGRDRRPWRSVRPSPAPRP